MEELSYVLTQYFVSCIHVPLYFSLPLIFTSLAAPCWALAVCAYSCWICSPFYKIAKSRESYYIFHSCLADPLLISPYGWWLHDLRAQFLELYTACILSRYNWDRAFHFPGKFPFLVKTITASVRLGVVYLNLVLSTSRDVAMTI